MRKFLIPVLVVGAAMAATPAAAQSWRVQPTIVRMVQQDLAQLNNQITRAQQRRAISAREATSLRRMASQVQGQARAFSRNGFDRRELAVLEINVNRVRQALRLERRDYDGRRG